MIQEAYQKWMELSTRYTNDVDYAEFLWKQIKKEYTSKGRYYHNLNHITTMLNEAENSRSELYDEDAVLFAIWFHDIIYKSSRKDNEEKSATHASSALQKLELKNSSIEKISTLIISTKKHQVVLDENEDNAFLLDFDLGILGQSWETYSSYVTSIRKEYRLYPDVLYKPVRKKVLESFLSRDIIYFTDKYRVLYEAQARKNIEKEIKLLS